MRVSYYDLDNIKKCIEEKAPNSSVYIDFGKADHSSRDRKEYVEVSIRDEENDRTLFCSIYDDIFQAYPILLGIYYGLCIGKDDVFDYYPTPSGSDWE